MSKGLDISQLNSAEKKQESVWNKDINLSKAFGLKKKHLFYESLATLLEAGLDLKAAIHLLFEEEQSKKAKQILEEIEHDLVKGNALSVILEKHDAFSDFEFNSIAVGEETGRLQDILRDLASYFKEKLEYRSLVISAISYPIFLLVTSFAIIVFMLMYVVPMLEEVFKQFDRELPAITQTVLDISRFVIDKNYVLLLIPIFIVALRLSFKKVESARFVLQAITLRVPLLKAWFLRDMQVGFVSSLKILTESNVHLVRALELIERNTKYLMLKRDLEKVRNEVEQGELLNKSLKKLPYFSKRTLAYLKLGEESGKFSLMLAKLEEQLKQEMKTFSTSLGKILDPIILVVVGLIIGLILVAMYIPIFQMSTTVQ